jgi:hypothetical protein
MVYRFLEYDRVELQALDLYRPRKNSCAQLKNHSIDQIIFKTQA